MFLIAGLILLLAGTSWFTTAETVGWILLCFGLVELATSLVAIQRLKRQ